MLTQITISNFGLIDRLSLDFDPRLTILTGETGAGKTIIIEALRAVLGEKIHSSNLRDAKQPCTLEAVFELKTKELRHLNTFKDFIAQEEDVLIIHRTFTPEGRHKIKINGLNVTLSQLKDIGDHLVDFHGPHDHQLLLSSQWHRGILDRLVDFENQLERYRNLFDEFTQVKNKLDELQAMTSSREREVDLLSHQIKELEQVALEESACEDLLQKKTKINNAEKIHEYINELVQGLGGDANGASENIRQAFGAMRHLNQIDEKTAPLLDLLTQVQDMNEQLLLELRDYAGDLSFDPQQAQEVNNLCDIYDDIKRKYGPTLAEAQAFYQQAKKKYDLLVNLEHNDSQLRKQLNTIEKKLSTYAKEITQKRQMTATKLKKTIERELGDLGIKHVKFEARIEKKDFDDYGADQVTFYISPNIGEDLKPLAEIVSSGEAARVMLALKKALVKVDPIPVLIFDEIDAQIGGRLGSVIGEKLREISRNRQVILITHLPQIASFADTHLKVNKMVKENRAVTIVDALNRQERIKEMAQMMSGEKETRIAIKHANDMLEKASI